METSINACPLIEKMGELFLIKFVKEQIMEKPITT